MLENIKIIKGNKRYRIVITGYDYETSGSVEILGCIFNLNEKELIEVLEANNNIEYFDFNKYSDSNKEEYIRNYNNEEAYITPIINFSTYDKAEEFLNWIENKKSKMVLI